MSFVPIALLSPTGGYPILALLVIALVFLAGWWLGRRSGRRIRVATGGRDDRVTGCPALLDELRRCLADWHRREVPFSLLLIDGRADGGRHAAGNKRNTRLAAAATRAKFQTVLRTVDRLFEPTADTVVVVMPKTELAEAAQVVARLEACLANGPASHCEAPKRTVAACGLAEVRPEDSVASLLERAREALAAAKQSPERTAHFHDGDRTRPLIETTESPPHSKEGALA